MPTYSTLRAFLTERSSALLEVWTRRVGEELASDDLSKAELTDAMPGFLQQLVAALSVVAGEPPPERTPGTASEHGLQRLRAGFDVGEVVREYGLLGEVILREVEDAGGALTPVEMRVLVTELNRATSEAIAAYVDRRDEEIRREQARNVAFIAHEIRNPLGAASVALKLLGETGEAAGSRLHAIVERSLERLGGLVDDVLIAQSLGAGVEVDRSPLVLGELLHEAELDAQPGAQSKRITLEVEGPPTLEIEGDRRLLHSALSNLLRNAIKFTPAGGRVTLRAAARGDRLHIEVEDTCGGLPETVDPEELFHPFVQRGSDRRGLGLGLAITRQAVEAHGGTMRVATRPGDGCTFGFDVPLA